MSYDFHKLKTVSVGHGEVTIRIPQRWDVWPQERREGYWGCYEEDGDDTETGTLWIQLDHFNWDGPGEPPPMFSRENVEYMAEEAEKEDGFPTHESAITPVDGGHHWLRVYDVVEDGEPLRFWNSRFFLTRGAYSAIIHINFVLTHERMDEPEFVQLREIMDREVRAAFLDPFRIFDEEDAAKAFGPLRVANFADQVKLVLPEAMGAAPYGGENGTAENQWYCRLGTETSQAGMFVILDEQPVAEGDRPQELEILEESYEKALAEIAGRPPEEARVRRMPGGVLSFYLSDGDANEEEDEEDGPPLLSHVWNYVVLDANRLKRLQVILMIPVPELDTPPYPELIAYMDGAVRRAEFPGVG